MMKGMHESRIARVARFLATKLETENEVKLTITSDYADSRIFRIVCYMTHFCGRYYVLYDNNFVFIRKQG